MHAHVCVYVCVWVHVSWGFGALPVPAQVRGVGGVGRAKERQRKRLCYFDEQYN